jgi:citrate synthase
MSARRETPRPRARSGSPSIRAALQNAELAAATGAAPAELIAAALASLPGGTLPELMEVLRCAQPELERLAVHGAPELARRPAKLGPKLEFEPELARVRPDLRDHEIRGKLLFQDLLGRRSFFQVAAWSIAGVELSALDARLLEQLGVNTQLLDPHIWPLAVARRIASHGGPLARSLIGGVAALFTSNITIEPVGAFMRFLDETQSAVARGESVESFVAAQLRRRRTIAGFGRPVLGPDERVPHALRLAKRHRRGTGESVLLAQAVEGELRRSKGLVINSAGLQGAIMRDMGFLPDAAAAICALYFLVPLLAQHAFVVERRVASRPRPGAKRGRSTR